MEFKKSFWVSNGYNRYWAIGTNYLVFSLIRLNNWNIFMWKGKYFMLFDSLITPIASYTMGWINSINSFSCSVMANTHSFMQL